MTVRALAKPKKRKSARLALVFDRKLSVRSFRQGPTKEGRDPVDRQFGHNFGDVRVDGGRFFGQSCPFALPGPTYCPFGGACHTCVPGVQTRLKIGQPSGRPRIPRFCLQREAAKLGDTVEDVGRAYCDTNKGKMVWSVNLRKLPLCMADCAKEHELTHVKSREKRCKEVSALAKAASDAAKRSEQSLNKASKSRLKTDFDKAEADTKTAEKAVKEFDKSARDYETWVKATCREEEKRAYQAGIDKCKTKKIKKSCADLRETARYNRTMKLWEKFKNNPPNCPKPTKKPKPTRKAEREKAGGPPRSIRKFLTGPFHRPLE